MKTKLSFTVLVCISNEKKWFYIKKNSDFSIRFAALIIQFSVILFGLPNIILSGSTNTGFAALLELFSDEKLLDLDPFPEPLPPAFLVFTSVTLKSKKN